MDLFFVGGMVTRFRGAINLAIFAWRKGSEMARIVYSMMVSLDGYIAGPDGDIGLPVPEDALHQHFNDMMEQTSMELCGRRMYEARFKS